ncbi:hypothetical protein GCM10010387_48830 [Streptomyces inusitatus]|uniref:AB hydrolase-1 domain-containing protein n=1 Tax=Streptomyces inusitatus TaxID=68221 RepID=A0A918QGU3_9ACTN|nr:alpha/beta fold hydrolase [Streptomyces inusitatus]GGZ48704.1 hypothetical protein GCM10010387_48830 [Streptomyces inusitatus]
MRDFVYHGSDGCRLHATVLGQGPALILLHGGGADRRGLLPLARLLAEGLTVVLAEVRGHGRSVCACRTRRARARYAGDVDALLDRLGLRRAAVGGTGAGGAVALRVAAARPERVRAALVIGREGRDGRGSARLSDLAAITVPTLVVADAGSPRLGALSARAARALPHGHLARVPLTAGGPVPALASAVWDFLVTHLTLHAAAPGRPGHRPACHG